MIMPNHIHCILEIARCQKPEPVTNDELNTVGAALCGRPPGLPIDNSSKYGMHNIQCNVTLGKMLDWFKTMTTNEYIRGVKTSGWQRFEGKLWQRNYWEHVIRNQQAFETISNYIIENPAKWKEDKLFKE